MVFGLFKTKQERKDEKNKKKLEITANAPHKGGRVVNKKKQDAQRELNKSKPRTKKVTKGGKLYTVTSTDGGKTWTNPTLYSTPKKGTSNTSKSKSSTTKSTKAKTGSTRSKMEAKNRSIHGDAKIDALKEKNRKFKENRANMAKLRKTDPEEYRKLKKAQRRAANAKALKSNSSTWD